MECGGGPDKPCPHAGNLVAATAPWTQQMLRAMGRDMLENGTNEEGFDWRTVLGEAEFAWLTAAFQPGSNKHIGPAGLAVLKRAAWFASRDWPIVYTFVPGSDFKRDRAGRATCRRPR